MVATPNLLQPDVELHRGEFSKTVLNELGGIMGLASEKPYHLLPRQELAKDLGRYKDPDETGHYLFIGRVAFNPLYDDDMSASGFATMHRDADSFRIDRLFVHSVARGRRLGHELLENCIEIAAEAKGYLQYKNVTSTDEDKRLFTDLDFEFTPLPVMVPYLEFNK
jgi:GNAT superfamily N-acetyltransferase